MTSAIETPRIRTVINLGMLLLLATLWASAFILIKIAVVEVPPLTLIASRTLIASIILLGVMAFRGIKLPRDPDVWRRFMIQASLNSVVPFALIAWAESHVDAGLAVILGSNAPILRQGIGIMIGLAGICLVIGVNALGGLGKDVVAQLALVLATVAFGAAVLFGRNFNGLDSIVPAAGSLLCGACVLVPTSLIVDHPWTLTPSTNTIIALLVLAVFSTAGAFVIYFHLIRTLGPVGTTAQAYLRVPIGVLLSVVFLGETVSPTVGVGLVCVVAGIALMTIQRRAPAAARP